jgi:hypothetical protein
VFLPHDEIEREKCKNLLAQSVNRFGQKLLYWRDVPTDVDGAGIGPTARRSMPLIEQVFIGSREGILSGRVRKAVVFDTEIGDPGDSQERYDLDRSVLRVLPFVSGRRLQRHAVDRAAAQILCRPAKP